MTGEATDFLYPYLEGGGGDSAALVADLAASASAKGDASADLCRRTVDRCGPGLERAAADVAARCGAGGRLFTAGNGGSATDADALAALFARPPRGRPLAARSLAGAGAVLSALGNDVGFDLVFARQVIAYGEPGDVLVGFSTSGDSADLLRAFAEAGRGGLLTVGFAGYDGGAMAAAGLDHLFVVDADSVHRIQEAQAALALSLWTGVHGHLDRHAGASAP